LPIVTKRFEAVAELTKKKLLAALDANEGKVIYYDYITAIDKYLIPFFGNHNVSSINYALIKQFAEWRDKKLGRKTKASTINTHNSALNRIFEDGLMYGYLVKSQIPLLQNKGVKSERRPNFTLDEYKQLGRFMRHWVAKGKEGKSRDMRYLLRDYVHILVNTGMRHGTEAYGIKWKHLSWHMNEGTRVLMISVDGKTGQRELVARHSAIRYFQRIHSRAEDLKHISFEDVIKRGLNEYLFRLADGTKTENLAHTFTALLKDADLLIDRRTDTNRSLYSLRHTYATFALLYNKTPIFDLEMQMGTSVEMIRKHYSHITTRSVAKQLAGGVNKKR
jgi:integrase